MKREGWQREGFLEQLPKNVNADILIKPHGAENVDIFSSTFRLSSGSA